MALLICHIFSVRTRRPGKTKMLANETGHANRPGETHVIVNGQKVDVLAEDASTMYLGRMLCMDDYHNKEVQHRMTKGWAKFMTYKGELCDKHYPLTDRLKLFNSVVTPTVLYGTGTWTMTLEKEQIVRTTPGKMGRLMLGNWFKAPDRGSRDDNQDEATVTQPRVKWTEQATHIAEHAMRQNGVPDWVEEHRKRKWRWAGKCIRCTDGRWSKRLLVWKPSGGHRKVGGQQMRWATSLEKMVTRHTGSATGNLTQWMELAKDKNIWDAMENAYVKDARKHHHTQKV